MAEYSIRSSLSNRVNIGLEAPLSSPLTLLVEPASICSLKCTFCPTGDYELSRSTGKHQGFIDLDLFSKIIADVQAASWKIAALHLHKDGEPLLHPNFLDLCRIADLSGCFQKIETLTNATLLHKYDPKELATSGLTRIKISLYGLSDQDFRDNCRTTVNFSRIKASIAALYQCCQAYGGPEIFIKVMDEKLTEQAKNMFLDSFSDICDSYYIEHAVDLWPSTVDTPGITDTYLSKDMFGQTLRANRKVICPQPFYQMSITTDGWVLPCCPDWQGVNKIDNVKESSLRDIWNSKALRDFQRMMVMGDRFSHELCGTCHYPEVACVDNLDPYQSDMIHRYA